jgi:MATE family multidrug resistance protein
VAQNLGAGRPERGPRYAWAAFWVSVVLWVVVLLPWAIILPALFGVMHRAGTVERAEELVRLESGYAGILLVGAIVLLTAKTMQHYFFGMHRPKVVTCTTILGNIANVAGNYVLIYGEAGLPALGLPGVPGVPALGIHGAALGTVFGTLVEAVIPVCIFLGRRMNRELHTRSQWRLDRAAVRSLLKVGWPAAVQFGNEIVCWSIFMTVLVGSFGADHMTAGWATLGYMHMSFMPAVGCSVAVTSLVGRYIGAGQPDVAVARARLGVGMAMAYMTVCAVTFVLFRRELIGLFVGGDASPEQAARIIQIGATLMICAAIFQTCDALGIVYTGALRGAGDTVWPGMATMVMSWVFIVGLGWGLVMLRPQWESLGPWIGAAVYIIVYAGVMTWRFETGRWRCINLLEGYQPPSPTPPPLTAPSVGGQQDGGQPPFPS